MGSGSGLRIYMVKDVRCRRLQGVGAWGPGIRGFRCTSGFTLDLTENENSVYRSTDCFCRQNTQDFNIEQSAWLYTVCLQRQDELSFVASIGGVLDCSSRDVTCACLGFYMCFSHGIKHVSTHSPTSTPDHAAHVKQYL